MAGDWRARDSIPPMSSNAMAPPAVKAGKGRLAFDEFATTVA
jgi:hypothetical protein